MVISGLNGFTWVKAGRKMVKSKGDMIDGTVNADKGARCNLQSESY